MATLAGKKRLNEEKRKLVFDFFKKDIDTDVNMLALRYNTNKNTIYKWRKEFKDKFVNNK